MLPFILVNFLHLTVKEYLKFWCSSIPFYATSYDSFPDSNENQYNCHIILIEEGDTKMHFEQRSFFQRLYMKAGEKGKVHRL